MVQIGKDDMDDERARRSPQETLMPLRFIHGLRSHIHCLVIVPLVIIVTTWPTFPHLFDGDELWLHTSQIDKWQPIWDAKHIERALAGQSELYHTDAMFHPQGYSLAFYLINIPHALASAALGTLLPVDRRQQSALSGHALFQRLWRLRAHPALDQGQVDCSLWRRLCRRRHSLYKRHDAARHHYDRDAAA